MIFKNFPDQDRIQFYQDWTRTEKFHSPLISDELSSVIRPSHFCQVRVTSPSSQSRVRII